MQLWREKPGRQNKEGAKDQRQVDHVAVTVEHLVLVIIVKIRFLKKDQKQVLSTVCYSIKNMIGQLISVVKKQITKAS